jgi:hypothetical protein
LAPRRAAARQGSGEKQLRGLLRHTPEWSDPHAREAAAVRAEASGMPELSVALRARALSALRKRHFFALCHDWRYRCDVWRHMLDTGDGAPPEQLLLQQRAPPPSPPPRPPPLSTQQLAVSAIQRDLAPVAAAFANHFFTPALLSACCAEPLAPIKTIDLTTLFSVRDFGRGLSAQQLGVASRLRAASVALAASGNARGVAWRLGSAAPLLAETSVHSLLLLSSAFATACDDVYAHLPPLLGRPLSAPEAAHTAGLLASCGAVMTFVHVATSLLAQLRDGAGGAYLDAGAAIVEQVAEIMGSTARASEARLAAFDARLAKDPHGWRHTFFAHAAATGVALPGPVRV